MMTKASALDCRALRSKFAGPYIANNGYDSCAPKRRYVTAPWTGTPFLANPDLARRYRENLPLNAADPLTFYGGDEAGYTDYPFYRGTETRAARPLRRG